jgi:hypothetical protein
LRTASSEQPKRRASPSSATIAVAVTGPTERLGDLDGEGADAARRTVDQDLLSRSHLCPVPHSLQRCDAGDGKGRSLLERDRRRRLGADHVARCARVLGEAAAVNGTAAPAEDLVAHVEIGDLRADLGDRASDLSPSDRVPRSPQSGGKTDDVGDAARGDTVRVADAGRVHADQHVVITGRRRVDLPQFEDVRRAVLALDDRLHGPDRVSEVCRPGLSRRGRRGCKGALARGPAVRR